MKLHIRNYRGIQRADIEIDTVTIVAGPNGSGKSSVAEAMKACLTGSPIMVRSEVEKIPQKNADEVVMDGQEKGYVMLANGEDQYLKINYPSCRSTSKGDPIQASDVACGLTGISLPQLNAKDRAIRMIELIEAIPSAVDMVAYVKERDLVLEKKAVAGIWKIIEDEGWDAAHSRARNRTLELKGQYTETTAGAAWGRDKSSEWRPEGWDPEWDGKDAAFFEASVAAAQGHYDEVVGRGFVAAGERQALEAAASQLEENNKLLTAAKVALGSAEFDLGKIQAEHEETPPADVLWTDDCPHCGEKIIAARPVSGGMIPKLLRPEDAEGLLTDIDKQERRVAIAEMEGKLSNRKGAVREHTGTVRGLEQAVRDSETARDRLAGLGEPATEEQEQKRKGAAAIVERAHRNLATFRTAQRAQVLDRALKDNLILVDAMAPTGVRRVVLSARLEEFNVRLSDVSARMSVPQIHVSDNLEVSMGERPYRQLSESEKFRCRIAIQVAWALLDGSGALVIDNDVDMDLKYTMAVLGMLCDAGIPALLSIRADKPSGIPDISGAPDGISGVIYWLEGGQAVEASRKDA